MLKIAMIAGEASGDMIASALIKALIQNSSQQIQFMGIGGKLMQQAGLHSLYDMETLSVMGYLEIIPQLIKIIKIRSNIIKDLINFQPDIFIGIDAPDFNLYIAQQLKKKGIKIVHYVSPTIWAWKYKRIFKIKKIVDLMLCIFPFEPVIYQRENIPAIFVGNNVADNIELEIDSQNYKTQLGFNGINNLFTILVGSRTREIKSLAVILINTCNIIAQQIPDAYFLFPFVSTTHAELFTQIIALTQVKFNYQILLNQTSAAIKASKMVIAKSGTVNLEVALSKKPMLVCYKVNKFSAWILKKILKIKYISQVNILLDQELVPELLQDQANPINLAKEFIKLLHDSERQKFMLEQYTKLHHLLKKNAAHNAATAILNLIAE